MKKTRKFYVIFAIVVVICIIGSAFNFITGKNKTYKYERNAYVYSKNNHNFMLYLDDVGHGVGGKHSYAMDYNHYIELKNIDTYKILYRYELPINLSDMRLISFKNDVVTAYYQTISKSLVYKNYLVHINNNTGKLIKIDEIKSSNDYQIENNNLIKDDFRNAISVYKIDNNLELSLNKSKPIGLIVNGSKTINTSLNQILSFYRIDADNIVVFGSKKDYGEPFWGPDDNNFADNCVEINLKSGKITELIKPVGLFWNF